MMFLCSLLLLTITQDECFADTITSLQGQTQVTEGETVILSCKYDVTAQSLLWYRQYPGSGLEFLLLVIESDKKTVVNADPPIPRLDGKMTLKNKTVYLEISSAEVTDSALYFCAMRNDAGGRKIIFGQGTTLRVESKDKKKADVYKLEDNSCLATDYTDHKEVNFTNLTPVRYSGEKYQNFYSIFALNAEQGCNVTDGCKGGSSGQIDMEFDEKINFMSLGLFWLRILLLKTVVFNILMTFKAWMS